jgi:hypothetical protein
LDPDAADFSQRPQPLTHRVQRYEVAGRASTNRGALQILAVSHAALSTSMGRSDRRPHRERVATDSEGDQGGVAVATPIVHQNEKASRVAAWEYQQLYIGVSKAAVDAWSTQVDASPVDITGLTWLTALREAGTAGWEMAAAVPVPARTRRDQTGVIIFFKRPVDRTITPSVAADLALARCPVRLEGRVASNG